MSENSNQKPKGLSKALKLFYGVGDCGFTLMTLFLLENLGTLILL